MQEIKADQTTYAVRTLLEQGRAATVHSVYRRTINLTLGSGELISLISHDTCIHPFAVRLKAGAMEKLKEIREGERASVSQKKIVFSCGTELTLENAKYLDLSSALYRGAVPERHLLALLGRIAVLNSARSALGFLVNPSLDSVLRVREKQLRSFIEMAVMGRVESAFTCGKDLLGLGWGLTPSCDDFIVGLLAALWIREDCCPEHTAWLGKQLYKEAGKATTPISQNFLKWASEGQFSLGILEVLECLRREDGQRLEKKTEQLLAMGHSSGCDTLLGLVCGLQAGKGGIMYE